MMKYISIISLALAIGVNSTPIAAQNTPAFETDSIAEESNKKAWEFGIGGSALNMTRFSLIDFSKNSNGGYNINTQKKDVIFGGNIYAARELNKHFYLDFQGTLGYTRDEIRDGKDNRFLLMGGLGLQWRLGEYFGSKYIDPYLRVGANYMYKNFNIVYNGLETFEKEELKWELNNLYNKESADKKHAFPIAAGAGVNMWLNDRVGIGIQADYLIMPYKNVANVLEGTVRLMWRFGGKSKKPRPVNRYIEIEKPVEVIREVEVIKEKEVHIDHFGELFNNILFEFDKAVLTDESEKILDEISSIIKDNPEKKYLITGNTDAKGSASYNLDLSRKRVSTIINGLKERGVPANILKGRGLGAKAAFASPSAPDNIRRGDRKVTVEIISNQEYWDHLPETIM